MVIKLINKVYTRNKVNVIFCCCCCVCVPSIWNRYLTLIRTFCVTHSIDFECAVQKNIPFFFLLYHLNKALHFNRMGHFMCLLFIVFRFFVVKFVWDFRHILTDYRNSTVAFLLFLIHCCWQIHSIRHSIDGISFSLSLNVLIAIFIANISHNVSQTSNLYFML